MISVPRAASPRPQPRLCGATRRPRSNSPTPALKARRPRLGRRRRSRRPRRRPLWNRPRRPPATPAPAADPALPPPRSPQAVILYKKGDVAGLTALAARPLTRTSDRRSNGRRCAPTRTRPSTRSPPSSRRIRAGQAARGFASGRKPNSAAHPQAPAQVAAFFANDPPQSSAGKIAAARAAQAMGRAEEASQIIRALWRDGNVDALSESVILREFGSSLTKADHAYRADRLLYTGLPQRWRPRRGACRSRRLGARSGPHRGGSRADEPGARQGGSAGVAQRSRSPVLQDPVRSPRRAGLRGGGPAEPRAARSRRARQSGSVVERAEDGRPRAPRPRRAATCL